jgi:hypothetical protein
MLTTSTPRRGVPTRGMCVRYGVKHPRTIRRWEIQGVIPPPDFVINKRKYWWEATLDEHDRRTVAARGASKQSNCGQSRPVTPEQ